MNIFKSFRGNDCFDMYILSLFQVQTVRLIFYLFENDMWIKALLELVLKCEQIKKYPKIDIKFYAFPMNLPVLYIHWNLLLMNFIKELKSIQYSALMKGLIKKSCNSEEQRSSYHIPCNSPFCLIILQCVHTCRNDVYMQLRITCREVYD